MNNDKVFSVEALGVTDPSAQIFVDSDREAKASRWKRRVITFVAGALSAQAAILIWNDEFLEFVEALKAAL